MLLSHPGFGFRCLPTVWSKETLSVLSHRFFGIFYLFQVDLSHSALKNVKIFLEIPSHSHLP